MADPRADRPLRLLVQHFALPRYRLPVFARLAATPGIDLEVVYGEAPGLENVAASGFRAGRSKVRRVRTPFGALLWDSSQWQGARRGGADVLVMAWNIRSVSLIPALLRARRNGVPTLLWGHGYSRRETRLGERVRRFVAGRADGVVFYARRDADRFAAATGRSQSTFAAPNSLDQAPIQEARRQWLSDPGRLAAFRDEHALGAGPTVLFVSRYKPQNRVDLLLIAAGRLRSRHPGLNVVLIGDGMADRDELRDLVATLGLGDAVRFVGPLYGEEHLAPWFLSSDVFCYPSNLGLSVLHAFGYGLPVVTGDDEASNPPEWHAVAHGVNGLQFTAGDVDALEAALDRVLGDDALRAGLSKEARRAALEVYTLDAMVAGLLEAVRYAAGTARGPHPRLG